MNDENINIETNENLEQTEQTNSMEQSVLSNMFKDWFLDYASYVILERAVPHLYDGLKPVHRRILHSMKRLDDGRYNKVANIIGHTMQFHPHGDASIGDAIVQLGQKDLLIDTQGNWGNILTGDRAAAPRYIEARLSKFALDVVFNDKTTFWKPSYDGRNKEPIALPVKFPLLLAQGVEGIAVGLASKILPHNFIEIIDAAINYLKEKEFTLLPDFPTGGLADFSRYNDGLRGGRILVRAKIEKLNNKTLVIKELPFGKNTTSLIESIVKANDRGKIKIKKIDDNTSENVEIVIHLHSGISSDKTIDALYAFTDCEISISPNSCIINEDRPEFLGISEILKISVNNTVELLRRELQIRKDELLNSLHFASLEKIFIENKVYKVIEKSENEEEMYSRISDGLKPFIKEFIREITHDDLERLSKIPMRRMAKFNTFKADQYIANLKEEIEKINHNLDTIIDFAINYYKELKKKYAKGKERKTEIRSFDNVVATKVVIANEKLYVNRKEGFIGTSLKKDEFVSECSDIDDIIVFRNDGKYIITKVSNKTFVGKNILYVAVFNKNDKRTTYNVIYRDGKIGKTMVKRFSVTSITRDKEYDLTKGTEGSKVLYFSPNPNGEAEVVKVFLKPRPKLKKLIFEFDFSEILIKGRNSQGNILTKNDVHKIQLKEKGVSTLGGRKIWFDKDILRINSDERGEFLGEFFANDKILVITKDGDFNLMSFDLSNHFPDNILIINKFNPKKLYTAIHFDGEKNFYYLKRFEISKDDKSGMFIGDDEKSKLMQFSDDKYPVIKVIFGGKDSNREPEIIDCDEFIALKSYKARGKRISNYNIKKFEWLEPKIVPDSEKEEAEQETNKPEENNVKDSLDKKNNNQQNKKNDTDDSSAEQISLDF